MRKSRPEPPITAAKRRKNAAHGASRGWQVENDQAPEGRKNSYDTGSIESSPDGLPSATAQPEIAPDSSRSCNTSLTLTAVQSAFVFPFHNGNVPLLWSQERGLQLIKRRAALNECDG
jgi:hypothetical protein